MKNMNDIFGNDFTWTSDSIWWPPGNGCETQIFPLTWTCASNGYNLKDGRKWQHKFDVSGLRKEYLKVELKEMIISISYEPPPTHSDKEGEDSIFTRWSSWRDSLYITDKSIQPQDIKARYRNGVLLISCDAPDRSAPVSQIPVTE